MCKQEHKLTTVLHVTRLCAAYNTSLLIYDSPQRVVAQDLAQVEIQEVWLSTSSSHDLFLEFPLAQELWHKREFGAAGTRWNLICSVLEKVL